MQKPIHFRSVWGGLLAAFLLVVILLAALDVFEPLRNEEKGFLDTGAALLSDLTLLAYVFLLLPAMVVGFVFARQKRFIPHHQLVMTWIVAFNWALIVFLMAVSYNNGVRPGIPDKVSEDFYLFPTVHLVFGLAAQILGTYLVIRMWLEDDLPAWAKVKNIKLFMRLTLAGWFIAATLGIITYITWYDVPFSGADSQSAPEATPEATEPPPGETEALPANPVVEATAESEATAEPDGTPESDDDDDEVEIEDTPEAEDDDSDSDDDDEREMEETEEPDND